MGVGYPACCLSGKEKDEARAEQAALDLLRFFGLEYIGPHLHDVAAYVDLYVREEALEGADARLVSNGRTAIATVRASITNEHRRKFAAAHELGHWLIHRGLKEQWLCTEKDLLDYGRSPREVEANAFAAELQLPRAYLAERLSGPVCLGAADALRREVGASLTAAVRRMVETTNQNCAMVMVERGLIRYYVSSATWKGPKLSPGYHPGESLACNARFQPRHAQPGPSEFPSYEVTTDVWSREGDSVNRLIEQAEVLTDEANPPILVLLRCVPRPSGFR